MTDNPNRGTSARSARAPRRCVVRAVEQLSPRMKRVHLRSEELLGVDPVGPDQRATLLFPENGRFSGEPEEMARARRRRRTYTLLDLDPETGSVAIDFALHGDGVAATWAAAAEAGHELELTGPTGRMHLDRQAPCWLLIADETGLPALEAILHWLPETAEADVHVEIVDDAERRPLPVREGVNLTWWQREQHGAGAGELIARLGPHLRVRPDAVAWVAAEASAVSTLRAYLQAECGLDRRRVSATPYWRAGSTGS
ncbi:siderophore-interacting protein [Gephyromycinifex aptenodytis]|uniref:siderophore-interacting protein n=1 Tax=Gephyromycinifex aptenodytis TaxID=2716227 RepID=UPI001447E792|nr:siderophore-interacting protein [Gephyromycinifex aptenodytis]